MNIFKGNPDRTVYGIGQYPRDDSALAMHMPDVDDSRPDAKPLVVTGTKKLSPCFRTAFKITPYVLFINHYAFHGTFCSQVPLSLMLDLDIGMFKSELVRLISVKISKQCDIFLLCDLKDIEDLSLS